MQLSLRIHPTRAALVVRTEEFFYINSSWTVTSLFTFHCPLSALPFTVSFFWPLPYFWRSWPHSRIFRFRGLLIGSDCIVNGSCQFIFHDNFCRVNASAHVRFKSVIFRFVFCRRFPCRVRDVVVELVDAWLKQDRRDKVVTVVSRVDTSAQCIVRERSIKGHQNRCIVWMK